MSRSQLTSTVEQNTGGAVAPFVAGKNKIINGDFGIWQRGTTFTNPAAGIYTADRWVLSTDANPTSHTISQQAFTAGSAPVAGYESAYFLRSAITTVGSNTVLEIQQRIEDVRTFANQNVTLSFWAKADSARSSIVYLYQNFGSGGSSGVYVATPTINYTTSWQRFTFNFSVPSISGKTIGSNNSLYVVIRQASASGSTLDIWGVQLEAGSVATPFTTATGTLSGELAACQRYYRTNYFDVRLQGVASAAYSFSATAISMRTLPTAAFTAAADYSYNISGTPTLATNLSPTIPNVSLRFVANGNGDTFYGRPYELVAEL